MTVCHMNSKFRVINAHVLMDLLTTAMPIQQIARQFLALHSISCISQYRKFAQRPGSNDKTQICFYVRGIPYFDNAECSQIESYRSVKAGGAIATLESAQQTVFTICSLISRRAYMESIERKTLTLSISSQTQPRELVTVTGTAEIKIIFLTKFRSSGFNQKKSN